jgi:hypothetical protein
MKLAARRHVELYSIENCASAIESATRQVTG